MGLRGLFVYMPYWRNLDVLPVDSFLVIATFRHHDFLSPLPQDGARKLLKSKVPSDDSHKLFYVGGSNLQFAWIG